MRVVGYTVCNTACDYLLSFIGDCYCMKNLVKTKELKKQSVTKSKEMVSIPPYKNIFLWIFTCSSTATTSNSWTPLFCPLSNRQRDLLCICLTECLLFRALLFDAARSVWPFFPDAEMLCSFPLTLFLLDFTTDGWRGEGQKGGSAGSAELTCPAASCLLRIL